MRDYSSDGLEVLLVDTSRGASCVASDLVHNAMKIARAAPEPVREEEEPDFETADEGFPTRKPGNAATRAARKAKKKMQKVSRRANR